MSLRYEFVELMHETMLSMNNEDAYFEWIYTMPDEPTDDDFMWFVENDDEYTELRDVFDELYNKYRKDGLYRPNPKVINFVRNTIRDYEIEILG